MPPEALQFGDGVMTLTPAVDVLAIHVFELYSLAV